MINHDGTRGGSDVAYEYFTDSFVATLDGAAGETRAGEQVLISYGAHPPIWLPLSLCGNIFLIYGRCALERRAAAVLRLRRRE